MQFDMFYIVRFEGTLTQGPNAGKAYTFATSWGGKLLPTLSAAIEYLDNCKAREPNLAYKVMSRKWVGGRKGRFEEREVVI